MKHFPSSIYRLQLNEHFPIKAATKLLPYLKKLGVEGVYCSPYFAAYSPHGYDIVDPNRLNPQVASPRDFEAFCKKLKELDFYHLADIVPNHMGIKGENKWWLDVLEKGKKSKYAHFFDIHWNKEKILIPILGTSYDEALKKGELKLIRKAGKLWVQYGDQYFPIRQKKEEPLETLLEKQHYQLVSHLTSAQDTSYRRFFNINELIGIRIEDQTVLQAHHKWIFKLLSEKKVDGLRIDHPDGLYDPKHYFDQLRKKHKGLILVEKILGWKEELPSNWSVNGTVGYEFLNLLTGIFIKPSKELTDIYSRFIGKTLNFEEMVHEKKKYYLLTEMEGDLKTLGEKFCALTDLPKADIIHGLCELLTAFPIYRSYIGPKGPISRRDKPYIKKALTIARKKLSPKVSTFLEEIFTLKQDTPQIRDCILCFQQLSAPIMAKGFEDISLYNYNRLLALNEVGSEPQRLCVTKKEFHTFCKQKQEKWPYGLLASSTHDTKRSLDVRMRLAVLSEIPSKWEMALKTWSKYNCSHKTQIGNALFPDPNTEYFLYQILIGVWADHPSQKRMWESLRKSIREAREHTSWQHPNLSYEKACERFLRAILKKNTPFMHSFETFNRELSQYAEYNCLSAAALKLGAPGIVDIYQGCENWRYTLVDPDNRSLVDYKKPQTLKSELYQRALNFRKEHKELFLEGQYTPIRVEGPAKEHIIAYLRTYRDQMCLVAAIRFSITVKNLDTTKIFLPQKFKKGTELFTLTSTEGNPLKASSLFSFNPFIWIYSV